MPPALAAIVYLGFVAWLFRRDFRERPNVTAALWLPFFWVTISGSRFPSMWLDLFGIHIGGTSVEDGSPFDAMVFGLLIFTGLYVLNQRRVQIAEVVRNNRWLAIFFAYCLLSILWSDFPFVALKRFLKVLGQPIMVLVILTEPDPEEAIIRLLKRCAFVWIPVSVLFIKYFPQWGREFSQWTGAAMNCGIALNKNMLGLDLFILGAFFVWYLLKVWRMEKCRERRNELILIAFFLGMIGWLFHMAQSSTSLVSFLIAAAVMVLLGQRWLNPQYIGACLLAIVVIGVVMETSFGIYAATLQLLGKDPTLSDRTLVWNDLLQMQTNPVLGVGFESFWLGDRLKPLWAKWWWHPNEAHNGYLETYLNLGLVGLLLLLGWIAAAYRKARRDLLDHSFWGRFRLAFLVALLFYCWTESALRALDPVFFVFFLTGMDYPNLELVNLAANVEGNPCAGAQIGLDVATDTPAPSSVA